METKVIEVKIGEPIKPEEKDCILAFRKRCKEMLQTRILREGHKIQYKLKWSVGQTLTSISDLPAEDDLRSFYMAFRFFYHQKEKSNFFRVANIVKRISQNEYVDQVIKQLKEKWHGALNRKPFYIEVNGKTITTRLIIDLWFNAHYFHGDENKQEELENLCSVLPNDFAKLLLIEAILDATDAVLALYNSIKNLEL